MLGTIHTRVGAIKRIFALAIDARSRVSSAPTPNRSLHMSRDPNEPPRPSNQPTVGYFKTKVRGRWLPAEIVCNFGAWSVFIAGNPTAPEGMAEPWAVPEMERIAFSPRITAAEHAAMMADLRSETTDLTAAPPIY